MPISIAILSFNHPGITQKCVDSCLQKTDGSFPIWLCHNGSEPKWIHELKMQFPQIEHLHLNKNLGYSGGANAILECSFKNSDWVLLLTNDCVLISDMKALESNVQLLQPGIYAPKIFVRKTGRIHSLGGLLDFANFRLSHCKSSGETSGVSSGDFLGPGISQRTYIPGTAFLVDRESWSKLKGFNESYGTYWEDVELSLRAHKLGIPLGLLPSVEIEHGVGKTCHNDPTYTLYFFQGNKWRLWRWGRIPFLWKCISFFSLFFSTSSICLRLAQKQKWANLRMLWRGIRHGLAGREGTKIEAKR